VPHPAPEAIVKIWKHHGKCLLTSLILSIGFQGSAWAQFASGNNESAQAHAARVFDTWQSWGLERVEVKFDGFFCLTSLQGGVGFRREVLERPEEAHRLLASTRVQAMEASKSVDCVVHAYSGELQFAEAAVGSYLNRSQSVVYIYGPNQPGTATVVPGE
jgi:hypothetical protein